MSNAGTDNNKEHYFLFTTFSFVLERERERERERKKEREGKSLGGKCGLASLNLTARRYLSIVERGRKKTNGRLFLSPPILERKNH